MYVPGPNAVEDSEVITGLLRAAGVGHLVSTAADGSIDATVLPFLVDDGLTIVRAHIARANSHWRDLDGAPVLMIVPVTDGYVSPGWYRSKSGDPRVVPTWNYEVVHVHGTAHVRRDTAFVARVVRELTDLHEADRSRRDEATPSWSVDDAPVDFIDRQLGAIVGLEVTVERVQAKRKLSQNRSREDAEGVIDGLERSSTSRSSTLAEAMRSVLDDGA